jgi:RES domain-containing protein
VSGIAVWRLCSATYADTAYDGEGAKLYGGRWSPPGIAIAYAAESRALAVLEILANADDPNRLTRLAWVLVPAEVDPALIERPARYPESWAQFPHSTASQGFGATWAQEARSAVLRVPSVVVPGEFNYLVNPAHPAFKQLKIGKPVPFSFDPRLAE